MTRITVLAIVSFGFYIVYWMYLTWRQYRDHTGEEAYPVWHALTLFIPIYGLFRIHAHMRSYNELIAAAGITAGIAVGEVVAGAFAAGILDNVAMQLTGGWSWDGYSFKAAVASEILFGVSMILVIAILWHVQGNLNRYWLSMENAQVATWKIRKGEVLCVIIGLLAWSDTVQSLLSASYRGA